MRGTKAKQLRREAQAIGKFYQGKARYYEIRKGVQQLATFGRQVIELLGHKRRVHTYVPKDGAATIRLHPNSVRGVYQRLKREYKEDKDDGNKTQN